ncbi:hypothetical protein B6N60_05093 [Richelia sinica FACHB-800]|uniref:Uncharacterized protein n=1 Tax=Richelia sinica FACHB-800 TaxID=1357546 RepID=A0A975TCW8_9NOST|nr:hypothetical protein B6N60_05093 [Richelia sinica FACHB-800]
MILHYQADEYRKFPVTKVNLRLIQFVCWGKWGNTSLNGKY